MKYRIKEERDARGWTQSELARRAHTTQQAIQRYESGEREPKVSAVITRVYELGDSFGPVHRHLQRATMALPSKAA